MAGLSAGAWAARRGRSVVLVEKGELGGSAKQAGFIWTAPSLEVLRGAIPDGDPRLGEKLIEGFGPGVEWVRSLGVEAQPAVEVLRFGRGHQTSILNYLRACELVIREADGCEILVPAEARRLLVEDDAVRGAEVAGASGEVHEIRAGSTLLATGGFQADPELRASLIHPQARDIPLRVARDRDHGHELAAHRRGPDAVDAVPAAAVGQADIDQGHVGRRGADAFECAPHGVGRLHERAAAREPVGDRLGAALVVLDDQHEAAREIQSARRVPPVHHPHPVGRLAPGSQPVLA